MKPQLGASSTAVNAASEFADAVIDGLSKPRKTLPSRFFYDVRGSELFEAITRLPEYYPARAEMEILAQHAAEITRTIARRSVLIEFGAGSSLKTEILIDRIADRIAYLPIDVSLTALNAARERLAARYEGLDVRPIVGDFFQPVSVPADLAHHPRTGFFPGSTIGNFTPADAVRLLDRFKSALPEGSKLIVGVDLKKDPRALVLAYNDSAGLTAAFNINLLVRINRELGSTIDPATFRHEALYNPREGRIEMHLVSRCDQSIRIADRQFHFSKGESIHTENSYKYKVEEFRDLAAAAGWTHTRVWRDERGRFSVHELVH